MAARKNIATKKVPMPQHWRDKIRTTQIMHRMEAGAMGEVELTTEQINAAKLVLGKVLPDLARTETKHEGELNVTHAKVGNVVSKLSKEARDELRAVIEGTG